MVRARALPVIPVLFASLLVSPPEARAQIDPEGFITRWLLLGPLAQPYSHATGLTDEILQDFLTDGIDTERTIIPEEDLVTDVDFTLAASTGLLRAPRTDINPGGIPTWFLHDDPDDTLYFEGIYGGGSEDVNDHVTYACTYVVNETGAPLEAVLAVGNDDTIVVYVNRSVVLAGNHGPPGGYGAARTIQMRAPCLLNAGKNRVLLKVFDGWGGSGFRLRFQTAEGVPIREPDIEVSVDPEGLVLPPADVTRAIAEDGYTPGEPVHVTLAIAEVQAGADALRIEETVPPGWTIRNASDGGRIEDGGIVWSFTGAEVRERTLRYEAVPPEGYSLEAPFLGRILGAGDAVFGVGGEATLPGAIDLAGFIKTWLVLGPYDQPYGAANTAGDGILEDFLTDGIDITEDTVLPEEGLVVDTDYALAGSNGLIPTPSAPWANPLGLPEWFLHADGDDTIHLEEVFGAADDDIENHVTYFAIYVENRTGAPIATNVAIGSDDSIVVYVNRSLALKVNAARGYGASGTIQDHAPCVLSPGKNRLLLKIFDGCCPSGFRLRFQDDAGRPLLDPAVGVTPDPTGAIVQRALVSRVLGASGYEPGVPIEVRLEVEEIDPAVSQLAITDTVPPGWTIANPSAGGTVEGESVRWTLSGATLRPATLTYEATPPDGFSADARFFGSFDDGQAVIGIAGDGLLPGPVAPDGFVRKWLVLGPFAMEGCNGISGSCGGAGQPPCCSAPGDAEILLDYLTDGDAYAEDTIRPEEGLEIDTDFGGAAASIGLTPAQNPEVNPAGIPAWLAWTAPTGLVDFNDEVFAGDPEASMAYACTYVENRTGAPLDCVIALGSDDSVVVSIEEDVVWSHNIPPSGRGYAGPPLIQDRTGPLELAPGCSRILVKVFEGWGGWNFALRFERPDGTPIGPPDLSASLVPCGAGPPPGGAFLRGDIDANGKLTIGDAIVLLNYQFAGGSAPTCIDAADTDDNGMLTIGDAVVLLNYQFGGGPGPAPPGPRDCGPDPTGDDPWPPEACDFPPCRG